MPNEIIVAIVGGLCVAVPTIITTLVTNNKNNAVMQYKMENLTKQVEKHNGVIERMAVAENSIKSAHHRIDELMDK